MQTGGGEARKRRKNRNAKLSSSSLVSSVTFTVRTFTAETQTRPAFAAMLNSTRLVICARPFAAEILK